MSRIIAPKQSLSITESENALNATVDGKLLYTKYRNLSAAILITDNRIKALSFLSDSKVGNIYVAKVKNIVKNINACFVEIANKEICFLSLKDAENPFLINRTFDGRLKEGDELAVKITRDAQKTKQASVTAKFNIPEELKTKILHSTCFSIIHCEEGNFLPSTKGLIFDREYSEIVTDDESMYQHLCAQEITVPIRFYEDRMLSLSKLYNLEGKMEMALERRIWLKSGAYLVLEPTEALTVIDVNTGKYESKKDKDDDTSLKINLEAAQEVAWQLRLRNLSGIIVVDFINMKSSENNEILMQSLKQFVAEDPVPVTVVDMTSLGLVEITRKKITKPLHEQARYMK